MDKIPDISTYNSGMRKSMLDKLWFLDKIPDDVEQIYDFGCADGSLLKMIGELNPELKLIGYDISPEMINLANKQLPNARFLTSPLKSLLRGTCLVASSVFHEIHSYSEDIREDYSNIFEVGADYIAIRDMFYSISSLRASDPLMLSKVYQREPLSKIQEFERYHGSIRENRNLLHYLLKYRYIQNWDREVKENYFPHSMEFFLRKIPSNYRVVHFEHYILPFLRNQIQTDFGFQLVDNTHAKILLEKVK